MGSNVRELSVFIDESGNTDIKKELYTCAAILIPTAEVEKDFEQIRNIAIKYNHEVIKSNEIRSTAIRSQMLRELCSLNFSYIALIVNKDALGGFPGLQFSKSFYKFLHKKFAAYIDAVTKSDMIHLFLDSYGTPDFQEDFERYFNDRIASLFQTATLDFVKDENNYGVQVADLIAGTLGKCYFYNRDSENADAWLKILDIRCAGHKIFPPKFGNEKELVSGITTEDHDIANCLTNNAYDFLEKNSNSDDEFVQRQCETLLLLLARREYSGNNYIYSDAIMTFLEEQGFEKISKQLFTSKVIGKLRDSRIIITGNPNGYRLALSKEDIESYVRHNDAIISPMIHRLELASELLKGAFREDILQNYDNLKEFVHVYRHNVTLIGTEIDDEESASEENIKDELNKMKGN